MQFCCTWQKKPGKLIGVDLRDRVEVIQWLFWQMAGLGPMAGQNHHFSQYAPEKIPYAVNRYVNETARLYAVLDKRLADRQFVAFANYSIADIAAYPWIVAHEIQSQKLEDFPNLKRWFETIHDRPATVRAYEKAEAFKNQKLDVEKSRELLFNQSANTIQLIPYWCVDQEGNRVLTGNREQGTLNITYTADFLFCSCLSTCG